MGDRYKLPYTLVHEKFNDLWTRSEKRKWFVILFIGTAAAYATRTSLPILLPAISKERNWSKKESGTLLSAFFWGYTLTQIIGGYLSDRFGGLKVILVSSLGWSLLTFTMPISIRLISDPDRSVHFIVFIRVLNGAFQGVFFPSMISLTSQKLPEMERSSFFSALMSATAVGTLISGTFGSYLLETFDWPFVFYFLGALTFAWAMLLKYNLIGLELNPLNEKNATFRKHARFPWCRLLVHKEFWACVIAHACQTNCFFVMISWLPTYYHDTFPDERRWIVNMVPWLFLPPCTWLAKSISERLIGDGKVTETRKVVQSICFVMQVIGLAGLAGIHGNFYWSLLFSGMIVGAAGFHNTAAAVNAQDLAPNYAGSAFGLANTLAAIPSFIGVLLAGRLLHASHSWPLLFRLVAMIDLVGWGVFVWFGNAQPII